MSAVVLESMLRCPQCGFARREVMPTHACQVYYEFFRSCAEPLKSGKLPDQARPDAL